MNALEIAVGGQNSVRADQSGKLRPERDERDQMSNGEKAEKNCGAEREAIPAFMRWRLWNRRRRCAG
jgi:hypothetical protein